MTKWIVTAVLVLGLLTAGGGYLLWNQRQAQFSKQVYPLPLNAEAPAADQQKAADELRRKLSDGDFLLKLATDHQLAKVYDVATPAQAEKILTERLIVDLSTTKDSMGIETPCILIGVKCRVREAKHMESVTKAMIEEVAKIIESERESRRPLETP